VRDSSILPVTDIEFDEVWATPDDLPDVTVLQAFAVARYVKLGHWRWQRRTDL